MSCLRSTEKGRSKAGCTQFMYVIRLEWNIYILNGMLLFHLPSCSPSTLNSLYPCLTAEARVSDRTNPCHACPHSLFWHGSNTISLLVGILADKNVLCTIHHDCPCEHVSPGVAFPEIPAEPKTEPLLSANGFCLPLWIDLHNTAVSLTSPNSAGIRETKYRDFNLENTAR